MISSRKSQTSNAKKLVKYCSERCRHTKPGKVDRHIEDTFAALLSGHAPPKLEDGQADDTAASAAGKDQPPHLKPQKKKTKGDPRIMVACSDVEVLVFGSRHDPEKVFGRKKNRARRGVANGEEWKSVDMEGESASKPGAPTESESEDSAEDSDDGKGSGHEDGDNAIKDSIPFGAGKVRPPQSKSDVNGSVGGEKGWAERAEETEEAIEKRKEGQKWAERKEMVRSAARRGVAFGFVVGENMDDREQVHVGKKKHKKKSADEDTEEVQGDTERRRKCEAIMNETVVEPSYAKGEWGIRWRE